MSQTRMVGRAVFAATMMLGGPTPPAAEPRPLTLSIDGTMMVIGPAVRPFVQPGKRQPGLTRIFDNLLPEKKYPNGTYFCCYAPSVDGPDNTYGVPEQWWAEAFTPGVDATVTDVEVGVSYLAGTNRVNIGIYSDADGVPGSVLVSKDVDNPPPFGSCCTTMSLKDNEGVAVTAGVQYWVVLSTDSSDTNFFGSWNYNTSDQVTKINQAINLGSGWEAGPIAPAVALAVLGR